MRKNPALKTSHPLASRVVDAVRSVVGSEAASLHEPAFVGHELEYVQECIQTGWVSSAGKFVDLFEKKLAEFTGVAHAVAVSTGTAALHMSLKLAEVCPGDEVLMPALTFVATANAVNYCGATPHFVDSDKDTLGICPVALERYLRRTIVIRRGRAVNRKTGKIVRALVVVHIFGHPAKIDDLSALCDSFNMTLIEDAAESLGSYYQGRHTGNWGKMAALSFNGNKIITTGGGGAILTNNPNLAKKAKHWTTTSKLPHRWEYRHDTVGYNYRLPNLNAALGCAQLENLEMFIVKKRQVAHRYRAAFAGVKGVRWIAEPAHCRSNYWLNAIVLNSGSLKTRDSVLEALNTAGCMSRPAWTLMHRLPMWVGAPRAALTMAEALECRIINIPSSACLADRR